MKRVTFVIISCLFLLGAPAYSDDALGRLDESAVVMSEILDVPEGIPQDLLDRAECVAVLPSVKKLALGIGGSFGKGAMLCRSGEDFAGHWGPPAMVQIEGGNIGFQIGGEATDFVLLVMNERGLESILSSQIKLGVDASVAAGPKGRTATAATDAWMRAEILSYSRSRGLFAGVSLEGSSLRTDDDANQEVYGREVTARQLLRANKVQAPKAARVLTQVLQKHSPSHVQD
jgi:lipid-binding SYLF domain-containing protein